MQELPISSIDPVDQTVGANIRKRRHALEISQETLAASIGVSFQQVQKYERGANRVSCSMLFRIQRALRCTVADLFEGCDASTPTEGKEDAPAFTSWVDDARRIDDLNPHLIPQLAGCSRSQLAIIGNLVDQFQPSTMTGRAA